MFLCGIIYLVAPSPAFPAKRSQPQVQLFWQGNTAGWCPADARGQPWRPLADVLDQCSEFCALRAFSGAERSWGVHTPRAPLEQCKVGGGSSVPQLPRLSQEISDMYSSQSQRVPGGTGPSNLSGDPPIHSCFIGFLPSLSHLPTPLKVLLGIVSQINLIAPKSFP